MADQNQTYNFMNDSATVNPQGQVISVDSLKPQTSLAVPTADYSTTTNTADSTVAGVTAGSKSLNDYISSLTPAPTQADTQQQSILDSIASLTGADTGKQAYQIQQENNAGIPDLSKQLAQTQGDIAQRTAEYQNLGTQQTIDTANATGNGTVETKGVMGAQQQQIDRNYALQKAAKASELTMLYAKQTALNGNIANAQNLANRAVDLKYQPVEDEIKVKQAQLAALAPTLNKQEKVQALAQQRFLQDQAQQIQDKKDKEKQIQSIMVQAAQSGADQSTLDKIQSSDSVEGAISLASYSLGADFRQKVAQQTFDNKVQLAQLAVSQANVGLSRDRLNFEKTKEAFDEAVKMAGKNGTVTLDANGKPVVAPATTPIMQQALSKANIDLVSGLITDKGLNSSVGPNYFARLSVVNQVDGVKQNFIAGIQQLTSQLSLNALENAKANGATFGALSEGELNVLANSATKLNQWAIKDKNGNVTGYNANEVSFRAELDKINNFAKLDYVLKGGNPNDVGIIGQPDGTYWTKNSNGTLTELK